MSVAANNPATQDTPQAAAATTTQVTEAPKATEAATKTTEPAKETPQATQDLGKTVLTESPKADAAKVETSTEAKPPSDQKTVVPEKYDLKLPKDSVLSAAHLEKLSSYAKEKGLSQEQAQAQLDREHEAVSGYVSDLKETQSKMTSDWKEQAAKDKEIGGDAFKENAELAKRVVVRFGSDAFRKELDKTGLGNHPELLRVFSRIGKAMADDKIINPGAASSGSNKSAAELLYGGSDTKEK